MRVRFSPGAAGFVRRALAERPELNHTLTVTAFLVGGCCSPNLPPEVHLGPPPGSDFRAVTVALNGDTTRPPGEAARSSGGTARSAGAAAPSSGETAGSPDPEPGSVEVYVDPLVEDFVRDWYGEAERDRAERAVLRIDLARYGDREELTVNPWPPRPEEE